MADPDAGWVSAEQIAALIERALTPDAEVRHDVKLAELVSGRLRQCDVVIASGPAARRIVTIVEVQKRKRSVYAFTGRIGGSNLAAA